jgi:hypothetical protein
MRVENPRVHLGLGPKSFVICEDCPWADTKGYTWRDEGCELDKCPTLETYEQCCLMAEEAAKGGTK